MKEVTIILIDKDIENKFNTDDLVYFAKRTAYNIIENNINEPIQILKLIDGNDNLISQKLITEYFGLQYDAGDNNRFIKFWQLEECLNNYLSKNINSKLDNHFTCRFDYCLRDKSYGINISVSSNKIY